MWQWGLNLKKSPKVWTAMTAPGRGSFSGTACWIKNLQGFPGAAAEPGKKLSVIQEVTAQNLRDAENEMTMRRLFEDIHAEPFAKLHDALLMTGRVEVSSFTRKRQQVFMPAVFASDTGKAMMQISAIKITINHLLDIRPPEAVLFGEVFVVGLDEGFKIILHAVVIIRILRAVGLV